MNELDPSYIFLSGAVLGFILGWPISFAIIQTINLFFS